MPLTDFLTEGQPIPAGSALTSTNSTSVLPEWYTNYGMQLLANQNAVAATPYTPYQGPRVADLTPMQREGIDATSAAAGAHVPGLNAATAATAALQGRSGLDAANPTLQSAGSYFAAGASPTGMNAAQPFLNAASGTSVDHIQNYMNPYTDQVVNRIGDLAQRNLREKLLPEISDRFIGAGQFGGTRQAEMIGRGVRDLGESTLAEQTKALQAGYSDAANLASGDLTRQGQLASTAGNLGGAQQGYAINAGSGLASLGTNIGDLSNADTASQRATAAQTGALAGQAQTLGLNGATAVQSAGALQQGVNQQNLDVGYADYLRQQGWPQAQIDAALRTAQGVAGMVPKGETKEGIEPLGYQPQVAPSGLTQAGSFLTGLGGFLSDLRGN